MKNNLSNEITINGVTLTKSNFPEGDGTGLNHVRRYFGGGRVTVTFKGVVVYREDEDEAVEKLGTLGVEFKTESDLMEFLNEEFGTEIVPNE